MTTSNALKLRPIRIAIALAGLLSGASPAAAVDLWKLPDPLPLRLNTNATVNDNVIRLGDLFVGDLSDGQKAVGPAPGPSQHAVLPAEWLEKVARDNDIDWKPSSPYDRVTVFRPGQIIAPNEISNAVSAALMAQGMPQNNRIKFTSPLSTITIPLNVEKAIVVRDVFYDRATGAFSAVVQLPTGAPAAQFIPVNGGAFAVVNAPVLKQAVPRGTILSVEMVDMVDMPESQLPANTELDLNALIGKAARIYMRAGQTVRTSDVTRVVITKVPVLKVAMRRGNKITDNVIEWAEMNTDDLPFDAILDTDQLIGSTPRHAVNAGMPLRSTDIQPLNLIDVPVAARDIRRGMTVTEDDIRWVTMNSSDLNYNAIRNEDELIGFIANSTVRAGQTFRSFSVKKQVVVEKGKLVNLVFSTAAMQLTAKAKTLQDGAVGEVVRVLNTKSNTTLFAEILDSETVRVTDQQTAMN